jgi:hypothetical protein
MTPQTINQHTYVTNKPTVRIDPDGRMMISGVDNLIGTPKPKPKPARGPPARIVESKEEQLTPRRKPPRAVSTSTNGRQKPGGTSA